MDWTSHPTYVILGHFLFIVCFVVMMMAVLDLAGIGGVILIGLSDVVDDRGFMLLVVGGCEVTCGGEPVCEFSESPGKQPFERIVFGYKTGGNRKQPLPEPDRVVISVPSALHSHKPPLSDVLAPYLPTKPRCMEIFARYLLPGWTSWGCEVLKLQHLSLYKDRDHKN